MLNVTFKDSTSITYQNVEASYYNGNYLMIQFINGLTVKIPKDKILSMRFTKHEKNFMQINEGN